VLEYTAYFCDHLSWPRRATLGAMSRILESVAAPLMAERGL
jgi:hypothetical protein